MIELRDVSRSFRVGGQEVHALRNVDLVIPSGQYLSIMGPSGSGKSTLLNILGLLDRPSSGSYLLDGQDVTLLDDDEQARVRREQFGFVFQFFQLIPRLTAERNVELPLVLSSAPVGPRRAKVRELLDALGLAGRASHRPDELSGGERQRVAIARATVTDPAVVLADEPTGNLDRASGRDVIDVLEDLHDRGMTVIVVTHDPEVGGRAERRIRMVDGRVAEDVGCAA